jgi:hypothetical protein
MTQVQHTITRWISAVVAVLVMVGSVIYVAGALASDVSHANTEIRRLDATKADKALVQQMFDDNRRDHEEIKALLRDELRRPR